MTTNDYLSRKLAYLKGLKSPSQAQQLLILLTEKPSRNADDEKQLAILLRAVQLQAAKLLDQRNILLNLADLNNDVTECWT